MEGKQRPARLPGLWRNPANHSESSRAVIAVPQLLHSEVVPPSGIFLKKMAPSILLERARLLSSRSRL
jgi:hypothetical protein